MPANKKTKAMIAKKPCIKNASGKIRMTGSVLALKIQYSFLKTIWWNKTKSLSKATIPKSKKVSSTQNVEVAIVFRKRISFFFKAEEIPTACIIYIAFLSPFICQ